MPAFRLFGGRSQFLRGALGSLGPCPVAALAQTHAPAAADSGPSLMPMLFALVLVLALIPASMWLLRRLGAGSNAPGAGIKVISQLTLGPRERLVVVEAGDRWLLLGVTASSVNRVGTLAKGELPASTPPAQGFAQFLSAARKHGQR